MSVVSGLRARMRGQFGAAADTRRPQLRPMRVTDLTEVMLVERAAYAFPWTEGVFRDCLRVGYCCWVLVNDGELAGHAILSVAAGEAHLLNLCVAPSMQTRGHGRGLLDHMLGVARAHGARRVFLEVRPSNPVAARLYERAGFARVGLRKDYYPDVDGRENAIVMSRTL